MAMGYALHALRLLVGIRNQLPARNVIPINPTTHVVFALLAITGWLIEGRRCDATILPRTDIVPCGWRRAADAPYVTLQLSARS